MLTANLLTVAYSASGGMDVVTLHGHFAAMFENYNERVAYVVSNDSVSPTTCTNCNNSHETGGNDAKSD